MCILLTSIKHPSYPLILLSNRDEFFGRPTKLASFVDENRTSLSPLDTARAEHGTWIGVKKSGRIAVLLNYREPVTEDFVSKVSRGKIPRLFLDSEKTPEQWEADIREETNNFAGVGGFSLFFGQLECDCKRGSIKPFRVISNRTERVSCVFDGPETTAGLSNSAFDAPWPKVVQGSTLLEHVVNKSVEDHWHEDQLVDELLGVLSTSTPPADEWDGYDFATQFEMIRSTIFVPPLKVPQVTAVKNAATYYGTRTQTVILMDWSGNLKYIERNLHSSDDLQEEPEVSTFAFKVEHWNGADCTN